MSSSSRLTLENWLKTLDVKADRVLDIGGSQEPVRGRTKSWEVNDYKIADLPNPHKDSPRPDITLDLNQERYDLVPCADLIFCLEVFDYIWNPAQAFRSIAELLELDGTAWISFQSVYPLHQPIEDDALRLMPGGIEKLANYAGLTIKQMLPRLPETNLWEQFYRAERMRAAKHEDHRFTGWIVEFRK